MRKRMFLVTLPMLFCLLFAGCSGTQTSLGGEEDSSIVNKESGAATDELEFSDPDVEAAYHSAKKYYKKLSMNVEKINHNEEMGAAESYIKSNLERYGTGNVLMFDAVTEDEPDIIRHIILVREDAGSDWLVECEVLEEV